MKTKTKEEIKTLLFEGLGTASMCWTETPKGIFDSALAEKIGNEILKGIEEYAAQPKWISDEEIIAKAKKDELLYLEQGFINGAKWMRDKLCTPPEK